LWPAGGDARLRALPTALRFDPHILAVIARLVALIPHGHERIPEDLQRSGAQDRRVARYRRVVQHPVARLAQYRVDFQFRALLWHKRYARAHANGSKGETYLEEGVESLLRGLLLEAFLLFSAESTGLFGLLYLIEYGLELNR
jgi:hypothetical protein